MKRPQLKLGLLLCLCGGAVIRADTFTDTVRTDTEWLSGYTSRVPGAAGHTDAQDSLLERVRAVPGACVWTQEFPLLAPVASRSELVVTNGQWAGTHAIFPIWPDSVRLKTTPEAGISGKLIYVGGAKLADLPARRLTGQIAVMEMSASENWKQPFSAGAAAVLLLGSPDDRAQPPSQQTLYKPRYYVPEGALADALRSGQITAATLHCDAAWRRAVARNICALVKPAAGGAAKPLPPVALAVPYDAMSVVMGLAPGADNAVDTAFLLSLLSETAAAPPNRAVLFCFVDAYGFNQLGMRQLLSLLTQDPADVTRQEYEEQDGKRLETFQSEADQIAELGDGVEAINGLSDKIKYRELQRYVKDCVGPEILKLRNEAGDLRLAIHRAAPSEKPALQARLDSVTGQMGDRNHTLSQMLTPAAIDPENLPRALDIWRQVQDRVATQLAESAHHTARFARLDDTRRAMLAELGQQDINGRLPLAYLIGLDLSDASASLGPGLDCRHLWRDETAEVADFVTWLKQLIKTPDDPFWKSEPLAGRTINTESVTGREAPAAFNVGGVGLISSPAASFQLPAATWLALDGPRIRVDTPQDRADRLDWSRLTPQVSVTRALLKRLFDDPEFAPERKNEASRKSNWRIARGTIVSESLAETVPRTPMVGFLTTIVGGSNTSPGKPGAIGIRRMEFVMTGTDGMFFFPPLPGLADGVINHARVQSYDLDSRGRIVMALSDSASMIAGRVSNTININESPNSSPARAVAFECEELDGPEFFDPRFLEPLSQYSLFDVTRGGTPKRYQFSVHEGQMCGLLVPGTRWQLILRAGSAGNRLTLLNLDKTFSTDQDASLREALLQGGFSLGDPLPAIPAYISAKDFFLADSWRMTRFENAGISSKVIDGLHGATKRLIDEADKAVAEDDGAAMNRAAASALANEIRAYEAVRAMGEDVTRGGIFLMILLVPFSVAMERLIFSSRKIGARISISVAIFAGMTALLWSFHPSFRITAQPMIIVMAFAILVLSLMVVTMVLRKFRSDMESIRSGHAEASGAQTTRGGVIGSAVWLGIANMRKRKLRTTLTATTIVLITFALLCFSSSTHYQNRRQLVIKNVSTPYPGVLIRQPSMRAMHAAAADTVRNLVQGQGLFVARYWWVQPKLLSWRLHVRHPETGKQVSLKAGLGLEADEQHFTRPDRFMPNWDRFRQGGACYLSTYTAERLGVAQGDSVLVGGALLELAGVFEPVALENGLKMLDGQSLLPYDYSVEREASDMPLDAETALAAGIGLVPEVGIPYVPGDDLVILPSEFTRRMGGELRSLALHTGTADAAEKAAQSLLSVLSFPMYYGEGSDVNVVVATPLIPRPPRNLLIPLAIAALIIFNTMLNSVAERKGEIHIYTSLGLAPRHVGMLFLAESATYGLMGSVFGYVVGQGLAKVLTALDLMGGITLNYSGSNVVMTMGMVMAVVLASAIVPAIMAGKLATPSEDMKWRVPEPEDGVINELLPFTVTRAAAGGLTAFIYEFMEAHCDGGIGEFTADNLALLPPSDTYVVGVSATTWLAPYDLGVRQDIQIEVCEDEEDICAIRVKLFYGSGQPRTWWRLNKTFLNELRRQLLGWRNVPPERIMAYIRQAEAGTPGMHIGAAAGQDGERSNDA